MSLRTVGLSSLATTFAFATLLAASLTAQQPKVLAPHVPVTPLLPRPKQWHKPTVPRAAVGGLWMIDANFKSTISLRNYLTADPITVTPVLYLSNGRKYTLAPVTLEPSGVARVSINDALQLQGISPWSTLSGYVEVDYAWPWDALCVTVSSVDTTHSSIFTYALMPQETPPDPNTADQAVEGMWWKQANEVSGFVSLSNLSSQAITANVQITDNRGLAIGQHSLTISPHGTKLLQLQELASATSSEGGIHVTYNAPQRGMLVYGGMEDQSTGYSASIPFMPADFMQPHDAPITYAEVGLMIGAADPMMSFPAGTTFTPYSILRNPSNQPITMLPTLYWMAGGMARSAQLPKLTIAANSTVSFDVASSIAAAGVKNLNGMVNLQFYVPDNSPALIMASGSVDNTHTYVFEVKPWGVLESTARSIGAWSTANGDDTMVTIWNPADEPQHFTFALLFSGGHYKLPIDLDARATRTFNISEIIAAQLPDADGNTIPVGVHEGSAMLAGSKAENEHILAVVDAGVYNVRKATCQIICIDCYGATSAWIDANPFAVAVGGQTQLMLTVQYTTGSQSNETSAASWKSNNGNITVSAGLVKGVSVGSATTTGTIVLPRSGQVCSMAPQCVATVQMVPTSPGTVAPTIQINPPTGQQGATVPVVITATNGGLGSTTGKLTTTAGSQIGVSIASWSDSTINATFTINSGAAAQSYSVVTTNSSGASCSSCQATTSFYVTAQCNPSVVTTPQTISCDGKTVHEGKLIISGANEANVTNTEVSAQSSSVLNLDLQGSPYTDSTFCSSGQICYGQNYIGYLKPGANINWNVQIFCSNSPYPSLTVTPSETITCQ